jgi:hypothetical protein
MCIIQQSTNLTAPRNLCLFNYTLFIHTDMRNESQLHYDILSDLQAIYSQIIGRLVKGVFYHGSKF